MNGWQPIETAPKDGTDILCISYRNRHAFYYLAHWDGYQWRDDCSPVYINYWMPLPPPPEAA